MNSVQFFKKVKRKSLTTWVHHPSPKFRNINSLLEQSPGSTQQILAKKPFQSEMASSSNFLLLHHRKKKTSLCVENKKMVEQLSREKRSIDDLYKNLKQVDLVMTEQKTKNKLLSEIVSIMTHQIASIDKAENSSIYNKQNLKKHRRKRSNFEEERTESFLNKIYKRLNQLKMQMNEMRTEIDKKRIQRVHSSNELNRLQRSILKSQKLYCDLLEQTENKKNQCLKKNLVSCDMEEQSQFFIRQVSSSNEAASERSYSEIEKMKNRKKTYKKSNVQRTYKLLNMKSNKSLKNSDQTKLADLYIESIETDPDLILKNAEYIELVLNTISSKLNCPKEALKNLKQFWKKIQIENDNFYQSIKNIEEQTFEIQEKIKEGIKEQKLNEEERKGEETLIERQFLDLIEFLGMEIKSFDVISLEEGLNAAKNLIREIQNSTKKEQSYKAMIAAYESALECETKVKSNKLKKFRKSNKN